MIESCDNVRLRTSTPVLLVTHYRPWKAITGDSPQVLKTLDIIFFKMDTYTVAEAALKMRHLKFLWNEHLRKIGPQPPLQ